MRYLLCNNSGVVVQQSRGWPSRRTTSPSGCPLAAVDDLTGGNPRLRSEVMRLLLTAAIDNLSIRMKVRRQIKARAEQM